MNRMQLKNKMDDKIREGCKEKKLKIKRMKNEKKSKKGKKKMIQT